MIAIIGAGPAGLAAAATLAPLGLRVRILDKNASIGERWRAHYDGLRLHTARRLSSLPGFEIPPELGPWVARDDFIRYQQMYARHHRLEVEHGTAVERVDRAGAGYRLTTSQGPIDARFVIIAGGLSNRPFVPAWPGGDGFMRELVHSQHYRNAAPYRGKRVLVVGTGNSGAEIATQLADGGAEVSWSIRTPPTILRRDLFGLPTQGVGIALRPLPPRIVDPVIKVFSRIVVGDLTPFGLAAPRHGAYQRALADRVLPILDVGIVAALKAGRVRPVAAIRSFHATSVELADGRRIEPDAVIACTGFRTALEPIVGHLGVLDRHGLPKANPPGMYFVGYTTGVSGALREIAADAALVARAVARAST